MRNPTPENCVGKIQHLSIPPYRLGHRAALQKRSRVPGGPQTKHESEVCPYGDTFSRCTLGCINKNLASSLEVIILL